VWINVLGCWSCTECAELFEHCCSCAVCKVSVNSYTPATTQCTCSNTCWMPRMSSPAFTQQRMPFHEHSGAHAGKDCNPHKRA
jgi:hypothetical protein